MRWRSVLTSWAVATSAGCAAISWNKAVQAANDPLTFSRAAVLWNSEAVIPRAKQVKPASVKPVKRVAPGKIATK